MIEDRGPIPFERWAQDAAGRVVNIRADLRRRDGETYPPATGKLDVTGFLTGWIYNHGDATSDLAYWTLNIGPILVDTRTWFITHWAIVETR